MTRGRIIIVNYQKSGKISPLYGLLTAFPIFLVGYCLSHPEFASESVKNALDICNKGLIPSLFPFIAAVGIINASGLSESLPSFIAFPIKILFGVQNEAVSAILLGSLGGFPIGAVCIRELYLKGSLSKSDAERLITFTNNASPAFCIGTVGATLFGSPSFGVLLYTAQLISAAIIGISGRRRSEKVAVKTQSLRAPKKLSDVFTKSISDSGLTMLKICSFAVFFAVVGDVICSVCERYLGASICTAVISVIELTLAGRRCAALGGTVGKLIAAFAVGFSGMSVHMQTASVLSDCDISMGGYYRAKLIQGILSAFLIYAIDQMSSLLLL